MFDLSWSELLIVVAVAVLVIGPKELPAVMHTLGRLARRLQYIRYAFSQQFEDFMAQNDLGDLPGSVNFEARAGRDDPDGKKTLREDTELRDFDEAAADEEVAALDGAGTPTGKAGKPEDGQ